MKNNFLQLRNISRKFRASLSIFFNENEKKYTTNDLKIINKLNNEIKKIKLSEKNKLDTHQIFSNKILNIIQNKNLLNFLQKGYIQQMFFIHNRLFILFELIELKFHKKWSYWKNLIEENNIGNPVRYFLYSKSSGNKIHQVYHLKKYYDYTNIDYQKFKNIIEFGGGYGNMATIFKKINKSSNYIIFDTKEVTLLQYYYLKKSGLDVSLNRDNKSRIKLISNISILKQIVSKTPRKEKNLFIANWSFSEIPLHFRKKLFFIFKKYRYHLVSFQHYFEKIDNLKYFNNLKNRNLKKNISAKIIKLNSKKNNYYMFTY